MNSIKKFIDLKNLIDTGGKEYQSKNLQYIIHNTEDILLSNPILFKTPIVRNATKAATVGYSPAIWKEWQD